jgi:hypothetical protein
VRFALVALRAKRAGLVLNGSEAVLAASVAQSLVLASARELIPAVSEAKLLMF